MEEKDKKVRKSFWLGLFIIQTIFMLGIGIWAITQKVEADKQKVLGLEAKKEALEYKALYENEKLSNLKK